MCYGQLSVAMKFVSFPLTLEHFLDPKSVKIWQCCNAMKETAKGEENCSKGDKKRRSKM